MSQATATPPADDLFGLENAQSVRLGSIVVEKLSQAILDGRLKEGDALPSESRIAAAFGVSKQVAREAIRDLASMGVVHVQQGKVARVCSLDAEPLGRFFRFAVRGSANGLSEAVELRRILEPQVAALAASRRTGEQLARLESILERMHASLGNVPGWIEADLDFHDMLGTMSGNRLLTFQLRGLRPVINEIMEMFNSQSDRSAEDWQRTFERHRVIREAIAEGDATAATQAMLGHFAAADDRLRAVFPDAAPPVVTGSH
ncbi:FadR family transcriptional regulator [Arsenicitalea aurantiaca]|uniref:FadR family transcriptional regulator n=1 Tax=Arsenicitalea aurantiaca TaxID=1783274 RepID=A0A433XL31_9HYPH|nr:FadR/GntR family transcriptional regulator [Arsenicitalea aurantiaca]RUT34789.1 FadR family transcriptional regulator [Arsenicitalea aurantiaca]